MKSLAILSLILLSGSGGAHEVAGTVELVAPDGSVSRQADGSFRISHRYFGDEVVVEEGRFRFSLDPSITEFSIEQANLDGSPAWFPENRFDLPLDRELELRAHRAAPSSLVVVDAETGEPLDEIEVVRGVRGSSVASHARSPVMLETPDFHYPVVSYFVGTPAHDRRRVEVSHSFGGERFVVLSRKSPQAVPESGAPTQEPAPEWVTVSGILFLPPEWGLEKFQVDVSSRHGKRPGALLPSHRMRPIGEGKWLWTTELQHGSYAFDLDQLHHRFEVEVHARAQGLVMLRVPPPAWLTVRARDAATGDRLQLHSLIWDAEGRHERSEPMNDEARIQVPLGTVALQISDGERRARHVCHVSEDRVVDIEVEEMVEVEMVLVDGSTRIPYGPDYPPPFEVRFENWRTLWIRGGVSWTDHRMAVTERFSPGRYLIDVPETADYERTITELVVEPGPPFTARIPLERRAPR